MSDLERAAEQSAARGVGFGTLAIATVMIGLAGDPLLALRAGAALALLMWAVLRLKALRAPRRAYKRTEVWLMLEPRPTWPAAVAQRLIGRARQRVFERHARYVIWAAGGLWLASILLAALGGR